MLNRPRPYVLLVGLFAAVLFCWPAIAQQKSAQNQPKNQPNAAQQQKKGQPNNQQAKAGQRNVVGEPNRQFVPAIDFGMEPFPPPGHRGPDPAPNWGPVDPTSRVIPMTPDAPLQVDVAVKVVEFQTTKGVETGLSAYFARRNKVRPYARVTSGNGAITSADLTFPTSTAAGITVFLDRLRLSEGDMEVILQALVDQNRAFILSRPRAMVMIGSPIPTSIKTVSRVPWEETVVVGSTTSQTTQFRDTGVSLELTVPQVIDDDGNWESTDDTYVMLNLNAIVNEEGQRIVVALDDQLAAGRDFSEARNAISVPEFISRSIKTTVWVRMNKVLILGGLYRNTKSKSLATLPWLTQAEDLAVNMAERVIPGEFLASPVSATLGNRETDEGRRELVFLIKVKSWRAPYTVASDEDLGEPDTGRKSATDVIGGVIEGISEIPLGIAEGIAGERDENDLGRSLGASE